MGELISRHMRMLFLISVVSVAALFVRNQIIGDSKYNFLLWNLFLGFVPLVVAWLLQKFHSNLPSILFWVACGLWLLFYPNAPYMISDFIHVDQSESYVLYDALMIFNIAILSTFYGLYSIKIIQGVVTGRYGSKLANTLMGISIVLAAFGVYLGRVLRLNSWDVFTKPLQTFATIFEHLFPFSANPQTWALVIIFSGLQVFLLVLVYGMGRSDPSDEVGSLYQR